MINTNQPVNVPALGSQRVAYGTIDMNSLATTSLTWEAGCSLSNTLPIFIVVKYLTGSYTLAACLVKVGSLTISPAIALSSLTSTTTCFTPVLVSALLLDNTQSAISVTVGTANGTAATALVSVYGFKY